MSKIFFHIQHKPSSKKTDYGKLLEKLNPTSWPNKLIERNNLTIGVSAYNGAVLLEEQYMALGAFFDDYKKNQEFGSPIPNGVSAFFRFDEYGNLEVLTNKLASRTIWYYFDENELIVSTSQRAIINIIGNYQFNEQAASWLISAGNIGPGYSWDKRIKHLNYDTVIYLDKKEWRLRTKKVNEFKIENNKSNKEPKDFENVLLESLNRVNLKDQKPVLTLSGGYDSRFVMGMISDNHDNLETMTWGISSSLIEKDTDGYIAKEVSRLKNIPFHFFDVEWREQEFETFLRKFVSAGEARIDHMSNYMDNFAMWDKVTEMDFNVIVRSDEVFGWLPVADEKNVRLLLEMCYIHDFSNFKSIQEYGMEANIIPEEYLKRTDETLYSWRDRLFNIQRQTFVQAALHDLFYPYIEMVNPLFSNEIVDYARQLNDKERTSKGFYVQAIKNHVSYLPIASRPSYPKRENVLKSEEAVNYFRVLLNESQTATYVSKDLLGYIAENIKEAPRLIQKNNSTIRSWLSANVPVFLKNKLRKNFRTFDLDFNLVAFRISMIMMWVRIIERDLREINEN